MNSKQLQLMIAVPVCKIKQQSVTKTVMEQYQENMEEESLQNVN